MNCRRLYTRSAATMGAAALGLALLIPTVAAAAETGPAWDITQVTAPTNLLPGSDASINKFHEPVVRVYLTNVGDGVAAESATPIAITDTLPEGITVATGLESTVAAPNGASYSKEPCVVADGIVTCEVSSPVSSGGVVEIAVPIAVEQNLAGTTVTNQVSVTGGGVPAASDDALVTVGSNLPDFGFVSEEGLLARAFDATGGPPSIAGSHPFMVEVGAQLNSLTGSKGIAGPVQGLRNLKFDLPGGLVADPAAVSARCSTGQFAEELEDTEAPTGEVGCPVESQVGVVYTEVSGNGVVTSPLYVMVPSFGHPAELAFSYLGVIAHLQGGLGGDLHLTAEADELLSKFPLLGAHAFLWGVPSASGHDSQRVGQGCFSQFGCSVEPSRAPFLSMPTSCTEPMKLQGVATSWLGTTAREEATLSGVGGEPISLSGCNSLGFEPTFEAKATTEDAESPTGLDVHIHQPQDESLEGRATATLKDAEVTLPQGMVLNAAAGNGLAACTEEQIGFAPEEGKVRFNVAPQACPSAAKVGTFEAETPLLEEPLSGAVYVAKPFDNPFESLLAIYLAIESQKYGIYTKLAGKVEANPVTGQLTATFNENPELPIEDIRVHFFSGEGAALTSPLSCGTKSTDATLTPWSTPEGASVNLSDSFETSVGCSSSEAAAPKALSFSAGTASPIAGAYSPFVLRLARPDGSQHITGLETTLPDGLLGKLAGISYCPESGIAQAISREHPEQGKLEQASPSCPASSEVGTVNVTAGSGSDPIPVSGHAYLAGPYKGAPLSLVVIVPAVAGPFDLGTVVDRVALNVGEYDARIHAVADPLPTIRDGIPLDVRSIELKLDRPSFTVNPTSCEVKSIEGSVSTQAGQSASLSNRFQVGECGHLAFKPKLKLELMGATKRTGLPAVKATVTYPKGGASADIARAQVSLPHSEFLEQGNFNNTCTKPVVQAGACPASTIYGKARAWSPLLEKPLEGPVYLVGGYGYKLPALVAELKGQIRLLLVGKVDTAKNGGIRNTFEAVPDAPVDKFVLELKGGKKYGLLINSENLCKKSQVAHASFKAQNGRTLDLKPVISTSCRKGGGGKNSGHKKTKGKKSKTTPKSNGGHQD